MELLVTVTAEFRTGRPQQTSGWSSGDPPTPRTGAPALPASGAPRGGRTFVPRDSGTGACPVTPSSWPSARREPSSGTHGRPRRRP